MCSGKNLTSLLKSEANFYDIRVFSIIIELAGRPEGKIALSKGDASEMRTIPSEELIIELPEGFELREEACLMYLFYEDTRVATFNSEVDPKKIKKAAENYLRSL